jgi:hypothetical protein
MTAATHSPAQPAASAGAWRLAAEGQGEERDVLGRDTFFPLAGPAAAGCGSLSFAPDDASFAILGGCWGATSSESSWSAAAEGDPLARGAAAAAAPVADGGLGAWSPFAVRLERGLLPASGSVPGGGGGGGRAPAFPVLPRIPPSILRLAQRHAPPPAAGGSLGSAGFWLALGGQPPGAAVPVAGTAVLSRADSAATLTAAVAEDHDGSWLVRHLPRLPPETNCC